MKPSAPPVRISTWKDLFAATKAFSALQLWKILDDRHVVGVRDPLSGETGYGIVMGSFGTVFGLCLYRGAEGFEIYRRLMEQEVDFEDDDLFAAQNCIKLELGPRSDMKPEDMKVIRELGLSFKGKNAWPEFRSMLPGYPPWFLTESEAKLLTLGLTAACWHGERVRDPETSVRHGECLMYTHAAGGSNELIAQREPWPPRPVRPIAHPILNLARINAMRALKTRPDTPWEADVFHLPSAVLDRERPYFVRMAVVCQQSSGFVFEVAPAVPESSEPQILADAICSSIEKHGFFPETIFVRRPIYIAALTPLATALGLTLRRDKSLAAIETLKRAMLSEM
jgi:hypothetical protein